MTMGNLRSVQKAFAREGYEAIITGDPAQLDNADKIVLPGVDFDVPPSGGTCGTTLLDGVPWRTLR